MRARTADAPTSWMDTSGSSSRKSTSHAPTLAPYWSTPWCTMRASRTAAASKPIQLAVSSAAPRR